MDPRSERGTDLLSGIAVAVAVLILLGAGLFRALQTDSVAVPEDAPVWMEMPPPQADPAAAPPPPLPSETNRPSEPEAAPAPLAPAPEAPTNPDPAFGLDDAAETGAMAVASGTTLAKEPEAVVRALEPSAGPVQMASMPASVNPVVPVYPRRAEEAGIEARVVAVVTTDTTGAVVDFRVEQSGGREFDHSVRQAVMATRFLVPRGSDGRARSVAFRLPYDFRLL
jgi:TonB family protein